MLKKFFGREITASDLYVSVAVLLTSFAVSAGLFADTYHHYRQERRERMIQFYDGLAKSFADTVNKHIEKLGDLEKEEDK